MPFRVPPSLRALTLLTAGAFALAGCDSATLTPEDTTPVLQNGDIIPGQYIVVMSPSAGESLAPIDVVEIAESYGMEEPTVYSNAFTGFAGALSDAALDRLRGDDRIAYIEPDRVVTLAPPPGRGPGGGGGGGGGGTSEQTPYGITRVNGGVSGAGLTACVLDSGVDLDHPDLNVDTANSRTFITSGRDSRNADDGNGHGTHVAGTIAAIGGNGQGVIGVAEGATIVAVKVLDRRGSGSYSGVIAGVDYVAAGGPNLCSVANMSLGGPVSQALDAAVLAAGNAGVTMVLAAGNESDDANNHSPARAGGVSLNDNVYAISAINSSDVFASFSNYGAAVEYAAPGVGILSTYKDGGYATSSGTSMAAPHAAGVFLLGNASTSGTASGDPDGNPDPIIVH